ncbi:hypothetical protein NE236_14405 [Actinoallomurus purpureus]|uniref:hypothetical protein n=1 Tax=Actinoallomurus purpureus TaxID=478114 RepID=UPI0020931683|nr:hypothetical protein [Actinoallomurus purpureus]MCO6006181.1 hypothetical protein [Actinoallomurus purpureus]
MDAGVIGHVKTVCDALEDLQLEDRSAGSSHHSVDPTLGHSGCGGDAVLAGAGVLLREMEEAADVTSAKHGDCRLVPPELIRQLDRLERGPGHTEPSPQNARQ